MREAGGQRLSRDAPRPPSPSFTCSSSSSSPPPPPPCTSSSSSSSFGLLLLSSSPLPQAFSSSPVFRSGSTGHLGNNRQPRTGAALAVGPCWDEQGAPEGDVSAGVSLPWLRGDVRGAVTAGQQCAGGGCGGQVPPGRLTLPAFSGEPFAKDLCPGSDSLFPDSLVNDVSEAPSQDVAGSPPHQSSTSSLSSSSSSSTSSSLPSSSLLSLSSSSSSSSSSFFSSASSSSWSSCGDREQGMWTRPMCGGGSSGDDSRRKKSTSSTKTPRSLGGFRGQGRMMMMMGRVSLRRCRPWLGVGLSLAAFLYVLMTSLCTSLHLQHTPLLLATRSGSGFRKLLEEEQDKGRLHLNVTGAGLIQRLPSCIIIGVRKCGTRALLEFLDLHPDIVTAGDEMHFFNDDDRYRLGLEWYRRLMPRSLPHQITVEKTPGYFISPLAPSRVHRMNSSIKLIVLLRHPTTRTVSDYTQIFYNKLSKNESLDAFEDMVIDRETGGVNTRYKAVQISMYHHHFRHWTSLFPRGQIHVVDGDGLITDPVREIRQIETFLGLQHRVDYSRLYFNSTRGFYCMHVNATWEKCLGASKGRKHPDIRLPVIRKMNQFFQPHNRELFQLIGRTFPWS